MVNWPLGWPDHACSGIAVTTLCSCYAPSPQPSASGWAFVFAGLALMAVAVASWHAETEAAGDKTALQRKFGLMKAAIDVRERLRGRSQEATRRRGRCAWRTWCGAVAAGVPAHLPLGLHRHVAALAPGTCDLSPPRKVPDKAAAATKPAAERIFNIK
ncbi:hypothetical protein PR202_ga07053 [Eleusine coracana subsp. coracana]|uniref:Uncharacterized protein n=1 Tax=Eleusine coracana subsp. coracana TaxID=191504 RepID=A0AAV5BY75_ELECO|nr:hypothetical protein PR202_ga07053 [Eleusine coracana subsp. coracana]